MNDPLKPAVTEVVNEAVRAYSFSPASETKPPNPTEVQDAIRALKVGKVPGPNGIKNETLNHLPPNVGYLLIVLFNAIFRTQYFPAAWKHARVFSILRLGKDPVLPSSYRTVILLDKINKLFEWILLTNILCKVGGSGLLRNEQFGFRPKHSTTLQLTHFEESVQELW